jgi:hypothetical protein
MEKGLFNPAFKFILKSKPLNRGVIQGLKVGGSVDDRNR